MKTTFRLVVVLCLFTCAVSFGPAALGQTSTESTYFGPQGYETSLEAGANLRLHLRDGDFRVIGTDAEKISIQVSGRDAYQAKNMKIQLKRSDRMVDLTLSHVPKNDFQVTIEIPKYTHLYARMRGGDLSVQGVTGDKDLELTAGDLSVQVGDPKDYSHVDLSVSIGDLSGDQFGEPEGWLGKSIHKLGAGKHRLHAHVMAGDLVLKS